MLKLWVKFIICSFFKKGIIFFFNIFLCNLFGSSVMIILDCWINFLIFSTLKSFFFVFEMFKFF